jgi:hypothetical protein
MAPTPALNCWFPQRLKTLTVPLLPLFNIPAEMEHPTRLTVAELMYKKPAPLFKAHQKHQC